MLKKAYIPATCLAVTLLLSACATRTTPFSYSAIEDEYTTPEFYTTSFKDKHLILVNYDIDSDTEAQSVAVALGAELGVQLKDRFNFAGVTLLNASRTEYSDAANREEFLQQVFSHNSSADFILDYRLMHWADKPVPVSVNGNSLCQQVALEAQVNTVLWRATDKKMLWRAEPEAKTGSLKCVVRSSGETERIETDAERKKRMDVSADEAFQLAAAEVTSAVIAGTMERSTFNNMKLPVLPGSERIVHQLSQLIAGQMPDY